MEPDGILNACTTKLRMQSASSNASPNASAYSRRLDLLRTGCAAIASSSGSAATEVGGSNGTDMNSVLANPRGADHRGFGPAALRFDLEDRQKGLLRNFHLADLFHA